ncbi:acetyl-CoA carboxylase biotin carboxylase subunit family protein [Streptomyces sp. NBC_00338]|uniref:ATP-grasp domain-containing protein n=1 Tax=Streptomyces sp. NBC_00338 TaxID=2975715 RepID=UPI0022518817|nr:ATP-grasp domain-containing protein [Streptomyces sp. NBC_00338]MCX5141171.1 ATP-grasp domain-containing protein [Streptomyces sp. NBC_00338]
MNVLILGHEEDCRDYIDYAAERGFDVRFLAPPRLAGIDRADWQRTVADSARDTLDLSDVDDVVSFHDGYQIQLELLRTELGLPARDIDTLLSLTDKTLFKAHPAIRDHITRHIELSPSLRAPEALALVTEAGLRFPLVLKPSNGFYSAGVVKVDDPAGFAKALIQTKRVCTVLKESTGKSVLLAEEYLDGKEYAVDGMISGGRVLPLQLHRKLPDLVGPLFHEIAYLTEPFDEEKGARFKALLDTVVPALGLDESPFHAEFRFDGEGRLYILEIAPRLCGGGTTTYQQLSICTGMDAYDLLHRLGREPLEPRATHHRVALEFDAPIERSGFLRNTARAVEVCRKNDVTTVLLHRQDGQFVLAPPLNFETVLTAYFSRETREDAEALLDILLTDCVIETEVEKQS